MKLYLKKNGIKVAVLILLSAIIVSLSAWALSGRAGFLRNIAGSVSAPAQRVAAEAAHWLEGIYGYIYKYDQLVAERDSLKEQLAGAREELRAAAEAVEENDRLRDLFDFSERRSSEQFVFEDARIVDWSPSNWSSTFTISKGASSGIEIGQCVVTHQKGGALAGQIVELGDNWATVRTVIDVDMSVGALVGEAGSAAMIVGDFSLMREGKMKLTFLTEGTQLFDGDVILTSGKGGVFPQGIEIGHILRTEYEAGGQTPYAVVVPSCDLSTLTDVYVIKSFDFVE